MKLGEKLKREREARGVSLQEISAATRVNIKFLQALERDDYSEYQAPVFVTGFLRSYANHLGLDADRIVAEYESLNVSVRNEATMVKHIEEEKSMPLGMVLGGVAIVLILFGIVSLFSGGGETETVEYSARETKAEAEPEFEITETDSTSKTPDKKQAESKPAAEKPKTAPVAPAQEKRETDTASAIETRVEPAAPVPAVVDVGGVSEKEEPAKYLLKVSAEESEAWVMVIVDDDIVRDLFVRPGQTIIIKGNQSFVFTTGRANAIKLSVNNIDVPITIPPSNIIRNWDIPLPE